MLDKSYNPGALERTLYAQWERAGYFEPAPTGTPYCLMIPPPNVTGSLHMGHAFQGTLMDFLTRFHRMEGEATLWQPGTDHAGIATQLVVERRLEAQGRSREGLGRERFLAEVFAWKGESGGRITEQLRRLGASVAWTRERFTMDEGLSHAVREVFVRLYDEGLIYRGQRLVNWDPVLGSAVSDLEVTSEEEAGSLWHIRYPMADGPGLVVATTRPETLLGDVAVAVHPDDERYQRWIGSTVTLPLTGREIPVIADASVDPTFGSGCVKITPAHDFNDYQTGQRHGLPLLTIMDRAARIALPGSPYHGLDRFEARARIVEDLTSAELLVSVVDHRLRVPRGERSRAVIEPLVTDQWYVRVKPLAEPAVAAVEQGKIRFIPDHWSKTYFEWMRQIEDWCISRQIWWGHRIPAWYADDDTIYVGRSESEVRARHGLGPDVHLRQDDDVLDTWFSSALWPFSTLGWPDRDDDVKRFYPTQVLVTGFDIIFFWVARMIMMGLKFTGEVPFTDVYIHGLVRDAQGQKMSKSRGNVLDPIDLVDGISLEDLVAKRVSGLMQPAMASRIEKDTRKEFPKGIPAFGVDALRFTFASLASQGRNINFDLGRIEGYRNFCNKLWNATRYVLLNVEGQDCGLSPDAQITLSLADRWIISRLQETEAQVREAIGEYRFDLVAQILYSFVWDEYCSWYLEFAKADLACGPDEAARRGTRRTLVRVLETVLRLLHPIIPFITETLWQKVAPLAGRAGDTLMRAPYPHPDAGRIDPVALATTGLLCQTIGALRNLTGEMDIPPGRAITVVLQGEDRDVAPIARAAHYIQGLTRVAEVTTLAPGPRPDHCAMAVAGPLTVLVPLAGLIDKEAELARLTRELARTEKDLERSRGRLANQDFTARAPAAVVEQEQRRIDEFESRRARLKGQIDQVADL